MNHSEAPKMQVNSAGIELGEEIWMKGELTGSWLEDTTLR